MPRKAPLAVASAELPHHEARRAWRTLGGPAPATVELWQTVSRSKPAIYRLSFTRPKRPSVYAKRSPVSDLAVERAIYERILPHLPLTVPRYLGSFRDPEGATWMFVEDVGDGRLSGARREHRVLASRWLSLLHRSAAGNAAAAELPDGGPARYLRHLREGRAAIRRHFGNPGLNGDDRAGLAALLDQLDRLEARWPAIERSCAAIPPTLVHGDFRLKNVRVRSVEDSPALYALDWEMAGWGVPAADLASAFAPGMTVPIDPGAYLEGVREQWPDLDLAALRRASIAGRVFQALAGTEWAAASLIFESPRYLLKPVSSMRVYQTHITEAAGAGAEWLDWS